MDIIQNHQTEVGTNQLELVSVSNDITQQTNMSLVPLSEVMKHIQMGSYRAAVEKIREFAAKNDRESLSRWKKNLPYFVCGILKGSRKENNVIQVNGIVFDFDHVADIEAFKDLAAERIPGARYIFRSPNDGVKVIVSFSRPVTERKLYKVIWEMLAQEAQNQLGHRPDATADMCRACFVSWDENLIDLSSGDALDPDVFLDAVTEADDSNEYIDSRFDAAIKSISANIHNEPQERIVDDPSTHYIVLAVEHLCSKQMDYTDWLKVGMALYNHLGDNGKEQWNKFLHNPNYPNETQEHLDKLWKSLQKYPSVKIGTLFFIAGKYGWRNVIAPQSKNYSLEDYPELIKMFADKKDVALDKGKLPQELQDYIEILNEITDSSEGAKLSAFLPVAASCIGNRIAINNSGATHFCNIWAVIIGPSSISRKTTVINAALKCMDKHNKKLDKLEPKEQIEQSITLHKPTQARLLNLLSINPNRLIVQMEMGAWMLEMQKSYNAGMKAEITDMFDGNDKSIAKMDVNECIRKPAFSIVGGTTEEWFFNELRDAADQKGGFLQRLLVCFYRDIDISKMDFSTRDTSKAIGKLAAFGEMLESFSELSGTHYLKLGKEAKEYRDTTYSTMMRSYAAQGNDPLLSYLTRIYDNYFFRFCILFFALKNWQDIKEANENCNLSKYFKMQCIDEDTAKQAMYLCDYYFENTKPFMQDLAEGGKLENEKKLVEVMKKMGSCETKHHRVLSASRMTAHEFRRCMDSLVERQAVIYIERRGYNNRLERYYMLNPVLI